LDHVLFIKPYLKKEINDMPDSEQINRGRWLILPLLVLALIEATMNWFNIVGTFGYIGPLFKIGVAQFGLIVGIFLAGYGIFHLPVGVFANRYGLRRMLLLGFIVESLGSIFSAISPNYPFLLSMRILSGIGASFVVGTSFGLVNIWFKNAEINIANGLVGGVGFTIGAAIVLEYGASIASTIGWREYLLLTGAIGLVISAIVVTLVKYPSPEKRLIGGHITKQDLVEVFGNKNLWFLGLSILGSYGAYFTTSELISTYASSQLHFSATLADTTGTVVLLMGIVGSMVGGFLNDKIKRVKIVFGSFTLLTGLSFFLILISPATTVWIMGIIVGLALIGAFATFTSAPGIMGNISSHNLALAAGLLLSMAAIGGFVVPTIFGILASTNYTNAWIFLGLVSIGFLVFLPFMEEPYKTHKRSLNLVKENYNEVEKEGRTGE